MPCVEDSYLYDGSAAAAEAPECLRPMTRRTFGACSWPACGWNRQLSMLLQSRKGKRKEVKKRGNNALEACLVTAPRQDSVAVRLRYLSNQVAGEKLRRMKGKRKKYLESVNQENRLNIAYQLRASFQHVYCLCGHSAAPIVLLDAVHNPHALSHCPVFTCLPIVANSHQS